MISNPRPLEDITVLDLTTALAGPYATFLLAGLGARVIKIENPTGPDTCRANAPYLGPDGPHLTRRHPDDISVSAINRLRNKKAVTLNLKHPESRAVFERLVQKADMLVENFSRGVLERLGAGFTEVHGMNPRLLYCSITGFGSQGEGSGKAMDAIIQALSGAMMTSGSACDPPVRVGVPFADLCAPLFGVIGLLAALHQTQRTGVGQHIDVSMLGVMTSLVASEPFDLLERCGVPQRTGQTVPRLAPFGVYATAHGYVAICAPTEAFARTLFQAIGRPELCQDPRFRTRDDRVRNVAEVDRIVLEFTSARPTAEVIAILGQAGVPAAEVRSPAEAVRDPQVVARGETVRLRHSAAADADVYGPGVPIVFSGSTVELDEPPPGIGEHNRPVYGDLLGYTQGELDRLQSAGVI
ncbi:MAG TPA: CoA transferase [Bryobacteraceae bacterium]|jgi:crotonobetainyl-CoA:carnitine CoA-transferase CaiB-like acyl-CoA transferase